MQRRSSPEPWSRRMPDLTVSTRIHVVGAGGAGMSALAKLLSQQGHIVSGSDLKASGGLMGLGDLGLDVWEGSRADRLEGVELLVASSAVPPTDAELQWAHEHGITIWQRPQLLEALTRATPALAVTGTHGKTSSTAMLVTALRACGRDPSFIVGGTMHDLATNAHLGEEDLLVVEADEAFGTFLHLHLAGLMVTNVEAEHLEYYESLDEIEDAFTTVVRAVTGPVVACVDDPGSRRLAERTGTITYGTHAEADWRVGALTHEADRVSFALHHGGHEWAVTVPQPGVHTALNAAGVIALAAERGFDPAAAAQGLSRFAGVQRRFDAKGVVSGVALIDDYAHHPTEVAATVKAALGGDWRRVWAVFQPHLYSRTAEFHQEFGSAFAGAHHVVVTDVFGAREAPVPGVTGQLVAHAAEARTDAIVHYVPHRSDLAAYLSERVGPGDLVLTMGAGDITLLSDELASILARS